MIVENTSPKGATAMKNPLWNCVRLALVAAGLIVTRGARAAEPALPDFHIDVYATGLGMPTALAFAPDGRLFVGDKSGAIRIVENGVVRDGLFATVAVHNVGESGLLALAVSPGYATDRFVYVFATVSDTEQRIIRLTDVDGVGQNETIIMGGLPTNGFRHNGGGLDFGPDGMLYFSIGDNVLPEESQSLATLNGKVSRIMPNGVAPDDNPFTTQGGAPSPIFAYGFRNPFRLAFAPDGRLFVADVGSSGDARREEIDIVTAGANYGWPLAEGFSDIDGLTDPIVAYVDEGTCPTAVVYYSGNHFPEPFHGNLFHVEHRHDAIYRIVLQDDDVVSYQLFVTAENGPVDMKQGPDGALYYSELNSGRILRVRYGDDTSGLLPIGGDGPDDPPACGIGLPFLSLVASIAFLQLGLRRRRSGRGGTVMTD